MTNSKMISDLIAFSKNDRKEFEKQMSNASEPRILEKIFLPETKYEIIHLALKHLCEWWNVYPSPFECPHCGKIFIRESGHLQAFCSQKCAHLYNVRATRAAKKKQK
jgi:hypothetical protein